MTYKHILVPIDDSPTSYAAIEHAKTLAQAFDSQVTIISVLSIDPMVGVDFYKVLPSITEYVLAAEKNAQEHLNEVQITFDNCGITTNTKIIRELSPAAGILTAADESSADLIIMGSHGRKGFKKFVLGSVAQEVLSLSTLPVMVIKNNPE